MKTLRVKKGAQTALLAVYTALLLTATLLVQGGRGVRTNLEPFEDVRRLAHRISQGDVLSNSFLYTVVGIVGNLALFGVWGFLAWKFLDGPDRRAWRNHLDVALFGFLFSAGIETVQLFLPTRAADVNDVFWNVLGAIVGAVIAHVDRDVSFAWE